MINLLFICSQNRLRSPTAEQHFASWPGVATASAGINQGADTPLTEELLEWADRIFVMEPIHRRKLSSKFRAHLGGIKVICLGIPDEYVFMQPALIERLNAGHSTSSRSLLSDRGSAHSAQVQRPRVITGTRIPVHDSAAVRLGRNSMMECLCILFEETSWQRRRPARRQRRARRKSRRQRRRRARNRPL